MIHFEPDKRQVILYFWELQGFIPDDVWTGILSFLGFAFVFCIGGAEINFYVWFEFGDVFAVFGAGHVTCADDLYMLEPR